MPAGAETSIVVADAVPIYAEAAAERLRHDPAAPAGEVASLCPVEVEPIARLAPDVLVFDPLFVGDVERFARRLFARCPELRVLATASLPNLELARCCMGAGFKGFVSKSADPRAFLKAVGVVCHGGSFVEKAYGRQMLSGPVDRQAVPVLTRREENILKMTARGHGNKDLAQRFGVSPKTVDTQRARGMDKLGLADRPALIRVALARGWLT